MPARNLLLQSMLKSGVVMFNPEGANTAPFTTEVDMLLGGVPIKMFPDSTEQFMDDDADPVHAYSPRLAPDKLEAFCEANIDKYQAFNTKHGDDKLMTERVPMVPFW